MNPELRQLSDSARQVVAGMGLAADEQTGWDLITELGWLMVSTPEEHGGLGMGLAGACALHTELGGGLARAPFLPQLLAIDAVSSSDWPGRETWLEPMMTGERIVTTSLGESSMTLGPGHAGTPKVTGSAVAIPSADRASHVLIQLAGQDCVALLALDQPGITLTERPTWDVTRRLFDLQINDLALDPQLILAEGQPASVLQSRVTILRDFALAADAVGGAAALLDMTVDYLQTRQQFARPLALFQALKHRCADLKALTEAAQALLQDSVDVVVDAAGELLVTPETERKSLAAKQLACSAYAGVAEESLQLHGGIGMTSEHDCHLFLKRALLNEHLGRRQESYDMGLADLFIDSLT
jgi:alkylation response protein AidB-like acyl-CoA dehydrogenase